MTTDTTSATRGEMARAYDHRAVEERLYRFWIEAGYFTPTIDPGREPFTIVIPPPNVTGILHHGHAMFVALQDLMIRWRRMQGRPTLWLPGTDHAGIATQNVVESDLARGALTRFDLGREKFVERVWQWKEKYGSIISAQLERLGASCDWSRERFTMDEGLSRAVRVAFVRLYQKGLIYKGVRIVNWCPRCTTTLSDLEVEHEERDGHLWHVRYPVVDDGGRDIPGRWITVATTRPETMLGDTGVAVHPDDQRYRGLVGHRVRLPAVGRLIPVVADAGVESGFGTGAVKVTPAHDPLDAAIGARQGLAAINVLEANATINDNGGRYAGLDRYAAREALLSDLEAEGLLERAEPHRHSVGECSRCHTTVEPWLSDQWFARMKPLAEPALHAARDGSLRFHPERFARVYISWLENIRDWAISRQLWWGHRIPVWYCDACATKDAYERDPAACPTCGGALRQDEDVLDTWFSSGLWPFSTLGWPDATADLRYFYPTSVMETGYDIIFHWVARMVMLGIEFMGVLPFADVYLHGIVRHADGTKMSKSDFRPGDDPIDVIRHYGADALRFTLVTSSAPGNDLRLSLERVEGMRNFANKIWNAARFARHTGGQLGADGTGAAPAAADLALADRWILSRLAGVVGEVTRLLEEFQFSEAGRQLYDFVWGELCDWYIEAAKVRLYGDGDAAGKRATQDTLDRVLDDTLRLLHPFMPFVTEEIWQHLPHHGESLMVATWPSPGAVDEAAEREMSDVFEIVRAIRNARTEHKVDPGRKIAATIVAGDAAGLYERERAIVATLAGIQPLESVASLQHTPTASVHLIAGRAEVYLPLAGMVDLEAERGRLVQELAQADEQAGRLRDRLANEQFLAKAPPAAVERERDRLAEIEDRIARLRDRRNFLG